MINPNSNLDNGAATVGIRPTLPVQGISLVLGNNEMGSMAMPDLQVANDTDPRQVMNEPDRAFPECAVTRAAARRVRTEQQQSDQRDAIHRCSQQ